MRSAPLRALRLRCHLGGLLCSRCRLRSGCMLGLCRGPGALCGQRARLCRVRRPRHGRRHRNGPRRIFGLLVGGVGRGYRASRGGPTGRGARGGRARRGGRTGRPRGIGRRHGCRCRCRATWRDRGRPGVPAVGSGVSRRARRLRHAETVVHETGDALVRQWVGIFVRIDRQVGPRVAADRVQYPAVVLGDDLDVSVEQHPVAGLGQIAVPERAPATVAPRVLQDRDDARRGRVGIYPAIRPRVHRPRIGGATRHPAVQPGDMRSQLQGQAGEGRARGTVVRTVRARVLPDHRLHLRWAPGLRQTLEMARHMHDGRAQHRVAAKRRSVRVLQREQLDRRQTGR